MDGKRALQYARSRHGNNNQGTDFARANRQQEVMKAIWDEVKELNIITNLSLLNLLLDDLSESFRTNLELYEIKRLYDLSKKVNPENIASQTISNENGLLCDEIIEDTGAYILIPCEGLGQYNGIRKFIDNQFVLASVPKKLVSLEIQNASTIDFLSRRTSEFIKVPNLEIATGNFTGQSIYQESVIYDNTGGQKQDILNYLQEKLGLRVASSPFPFPTISSFPDFVIVVTQDLEEKLP